MFNFRISMNKKILALAIPSIISNITVPLLGLVDVTIVGHLGSPLYIGAIAVGGMLFNMIYWLFAFLRMGTSGLTSQAYGKRDLQDVATLFIRAMAVGFGIALLLILLQGPILHIAFSLINTTEDIRALATLYFQICIFGAPAVLGLYGFTGWFVGMQNSRFPMYTAIIQNLVNIMASLCLVFIWNMGVSGVAFGTLLAQYAGLFMAFMLWHRYYKRLWRYIDWRKIGQIDALRRFFILNRDIFLRTLCIIAVTTFFTSKGAEKGEVILAVNTLLMQLFTLFSYIMDGFAYAGEALSGRYIGARNYIELTRMIRQLFMWGFGLSLLFTLLYAIGGNSFLSLLTNEREVLQAAEGYFYWTLLIPLTGVAAFLWDGVYIGATASRQMLYSIAIATALFFTLYYISEPFFGNHALWLAFVIYLFSRGIVLSLFAPAYIIRKEFY